MTIRFHLNLSNNEFYSYLLLVRDVHLPWLCIQGYFPYLSAKKGTFLITMVSIFSDKRSILLCHSFQLNPCRVYRGNRSKRRFRVSISACSITYIKTVSCFICIFPEFGYLHSVFLNICKRMISEPFLNILYLVRIDMINS